MADVLMQMTILIACGVLWQLWQPGGIKTVDLKHAVSTLVFYLLLPALVLDVLWDAPIGLDTLRISMVAASGVFAGALLAFLACKILNVNRPSTGALILAAAFPNVTYLGLPVLEATMGSWTRSVAIQYDLFATLPLLLTFGIFISRYYSPANQPADGIANKLLEFIKVPAIWAAVLAIGLNSFEVEQPDVIGQVLLMMSEAVVPLMLLTLGLSLKWQSGWQADVQIILPVIIIQLILMPAGAWYVAQTTGLHDELLMAVVLESAMPSMLIGVVLCDRFRLNTSLFAAAVTLSTVISLLTLPLWFEWMQSRLNIFYGA